MSLLRSSAAIFACVGLGLLTAQDPAPIGLFEGHADIGSLLHGGSVQFDPDTHSYTISGSGENLWAAADAFQFVWKKVSGDVTLSANISFPETGGDPHKKAVLMIRQSLDAGSAYADAALHGNGLTSLQARDEKGVATHEVQSNISGPKRLRIERRGKYVYMSLAAAGEELHFAGGSMRVPFEESFYIGLGVCAHNKDAVEKAVFSNVELLTAATATKSPLLYSTLETIAVTSTDARVAYVTPQRIAAPNWSHDGKTLLFTRNGRIERVSVDGGLAETIDTGSATHCNKYHGISPDGDTLAFTDESEHGRSAIFIVPLAGGQARRVTKNSPSDFRGWSPDGKTLAFSGVRDGNLGVYKIPAEGGEETLLTPGNGSNDNSEYSPDGNNIYFNSNRTGTVQIWRMKLDGTAQEQVTSDEFNNYFPHVSPDGRLLVFLTCDKSATKVPNNQDVMLRVMSLIDKTLSDKTTRVLAKLVGGEGTIDMASWSPDSRRLAFVSYQRIT